MIEEQAPGTFTKKTATKKAAAKKTKPKKKKRPWFYPRPEF
jgi:hypothetical protein